MISGTLQRYVNAYKKVCSAADPYMTYSILNKLEKIGVQTDKRELGNLIPEDYLVAVDAYLCQIILRSNRRLINPQIMEWISQSRTGKISIPYPEQWKSSLDKAGLPIARFGSSISSLYAQIKAWGRFFLLLKQHGLMAWKSYDSPVGGYVVFCGLPAGAIPVEHPQQQDCTVVDWFLKEQRIAADDTIIIQTNTVKAVTKQGSLILSPFTLPRLDREGRCKYAAKATSIFISAMMQWVRGNWKSPYIATAALDLCYMTQVRQAAKSYFFSNSDFAVRPFWSYAAERGGNHISLYFYSANINCFYEGQKEQSPPPPGYISMSWPHYLVIDQDQKDFLVNTCHITSPIEVAGSIDFSDSDEELPNIPKRSIALFDISPFNFENVAALALIAPYYTSDMMAEFLKDISECIKDLDGHLVWKRKRVMPSQVLAESYDRIIGDMQQDSHVILVPPGIAARRVLLHVRASISIPFTSTAILAKEMGKESVFYDPTDQIKYVSGLSRGLPVVGGKHKLRAWMEEILHGE